MHALQINLRMLAHHSNSNMRHFFMGHILRYIYLI